MLRPVLSCSIRAPRSNTQRALYCFPPAFCRKAEKHSALPPYFLPPKGLELRFSEGILGGHKTKETSAYAPPDKSFSAPFHPQAPPVPPKTVAMGRLNAPPAAVALTPGAPEEAPTAPPLQTPSVPRHTAARSKAPRPCCSTPRHRGG